MRSPGIYCQKAGAMELLERYIPQFGASALIVCTEGTFQRFGEKLKTQAENAQYGIKFSLIKGETTNKEIAGVVDDYAEGDVIVGIGGGKAIDTARAAADYVSAPLIIMPTVASNDAPCSALAVIHDENGAVIELRTTKRNPDVVLVDTEVIIAAPERLFIAGLGDALATWFEVKACRESGAVTLAGAPSSDIAYTLARLCYQTLISCGRSALYAVKTGFVSDDFDKTVQASVYLSGTGFESGGVSGAHAINDGFSACPEAAHLYHGEIVGFGTLAMLMLDKTDKETLDEVTDFMADVGLPMSFSQLGIKPTDDFLKRVADTACTQSVMSNMPFEVTPADVIRAMLKADLIGTSKLREMENADENK